MKPTDRIEVAIGSGEAPVVAGTLRPSFHGGADAQEIVDHQVNVAQTQWQDAANRARLSTRERDALWETSILNPAIS